jgi:hypothetical protein
MVGGVVWHGAIVTEKKKDASTHLMARDANPSQLFGEGDTGAFGTVIDVTRYYASNPVKQDWSCNVLTDLP